MIPFPHIDPVALYIGPLPLRWYGLAYVAGFVLGLYAFKHLCNTMKGSKLTSKHVDDYFVWIIAGVILGGRLGYVLFYNFSYYIEHPMQILQTWNGGMSFHGGVLGCILATVLFAWKKGLEIHQLSDKLAVVVPIGLFFGRIANFINAELYGRPTDLPWGMVFPTADDLPRHPSQLYEAGLEGLVLFIILFVMARRNPRPWALTGTFLMGYGIFRFFIEYARMPDTHLQDGIFTTITMGQILCLPMVILGVYYLFIHRGSASITTKKQTIK
ncbi:MAG: prolipoprotein diacylglyceryl transferase [Alphaproteobacteria bacterium]|nr:prolipoprotein diacylglyceryl transferase [Alphaproteobacteria bacterium]